ncbi:hypothetical protein [Duganella sp. BuS-21]|uniref:hypothetical protein n=1 Tax=Duganella sp. BuS-21 TaxID=2943848 RepID=UPI0035A58874
MEKRCEDLQRERERLYAALDRATEDSASQRASHAHDLNRAQELSEQLRRRAAQQERARNMELAAAREERQRIYDALKSANRDAAQLRQAHAQEMDATRNLLEQVRLNAAEQERALGAELANAREESAKLRGAMSALERIKAPRLPKAAEKTDGAGKS